jgi:hypothetical protein
MHVLLLFFLHKIPRAIVFDITLWFAFETRCKCSCDRWLTGLSMESPPSVGLRVVADAAIQILATVSSGELAAALFIDWAIQLVVELGPMECERRWGPRLAEADGARDA